MTKRKTEKSLEQEMAEALRRKFRETAIGRQMVRTVTQVNYDDPGEIIHVGPTIRELIDEGHIPPKPVTDPKGIEWILENVQYLAHEMISERVPLHDTLDTLSCRAAKYAVLSCNGNKSKAARMLGITRNTLRKYLKLNEREETYDE